MPMKLNWTNYKMEPKEGSVWFGGITIYVLRRERESMVRRPNQWRVTWYQDGPDLEEVPADEMPGLTDQWFDSLQEGMRAMERYFVPFLKIVAKLVAVETKVVVGQRALLED